MPFLNVRFHLSETLPRETRERLSTDLVGHHATPAESVDDATHIITDSETFEGWRDVKNVPIVTEVWVEHSLAANKMQSTEFYSVDPSKVFSGVIACGADLRTDDEEIIKAGVVSLGGQWRTSLTKDVTHLFAMSTTSEKYATAMQHRREHQSGIKLLLPEWFDRCIFFGKPVETQPFEWPKPTMLDRTPSSPEKLKRQQAASLSMSPKKKALYTSSALEDNPNPKSVAILGVDGSFDVWEKRRIMLGSSLDLADSRKKIFENDIRKAGGIVVKPRPNETELELVDRCDVLVTRHRAGPEFFKAWRRKKTIGTLSWVLHVHLMRNFSSPMDQLLHFPHPDHPIKGFHKHKISVTNYAGDIRDYLKKLIHLMGGEFTSSFNGKVNTALVAAQMSGAKTARAAACDVPVVNHTWLEDCFLEWKDWKLAKEKYVAYPSGVEFSTILGERGFGPRIAEVIAAEAEEAGEAIASDSEPVTPPAGMSQNSLEETEVDQLMTAPSFGAEVFSTPKSSPRKPVQRSDSDVEIEHAGPSTRAHSDSPRVLRPRSNQSPRTPSQSSRLLRSTTTLQSPLSQNGINGSTSRLVADDSDIEMQDVEATISPRGHRSRSGPSSSTKPAGRLAADDFNPQENSQSPSQGSRIVIPRPINHSKGKEKAQPEFRIGASVRQKPQPYESDSDSDLPELSTLASRKATATNGAAASSSPRKPAPVTPPPPSSSLITSPRTTSRFPTKEVSVVLPTLASLSAKKRQERQASTSSQPTSASAPPRSGTATSLSRRNSSPGASSAFEDGPIASTSHNGFGVRTRRVAAVRANQQLHDTVMPDVVKFQQEMRNRKRRVSGRSEASTEYMDEESDAAPSQKRRRKSSPIAEDTSFRRLEKPIKLLTTKVDLTDDVLKKLARLGAKVTNKTAECTHLVTTGVVRTEKFLCALAVAPVIVNEAWATESAAANEILDVSDYLIRDEEGERRYEFRLEEALNRARVLRGTLFKDHIFFMTPGSFNNLDLIRSVIQANGGQFNSVRQPTLRQLESDPAHRHLVSSEAESDLWKTLGITVYKTEMILAAAMKQQVDWKNISREHILQGS
ncbi:hypothetical protein MIND_01388500 [Mycena indigotica]|uniref:BRCT domain-containing protein n=1 Tax=Mycena indigotica TaxID=2126181 RepID=A0A8H6VV06_9AGAR|nr:uncharacterized protein MIND_01388500 [Mycena indigotica]KAF7289269.1 hypothetical protein MIND_01388500 [Mycena indigotica]